MDGNEKLLAAFQVECVEHLEGIRANLAKLEAHGVANAGSELDEAFRRAHSLKGASRITGAVAAEQVAHRLESLFSRVRGGGLQLDKEGLCVIQMALDAIEDDAACLGKDRTPPDPKQVLDELDRLTGSAPLQVKSVQPSSDLDLKLRAAFEEEHHEYLNGIRALVDNVEQHGSPPATVDLEEAFRCAHNLKGAARVANVKGVDDVAHQFERLLLQLRQGRVSFSGAVIEAIRRGVDTIQDCVAVPPRMSDSQLSDSVTILEQLTRSEAEEGPEAASSQSAGDRPSIAADARVAAPADALLLPVETVRLSAESLDRLLQSTGELLTESLKQNLVVQELGAMSRQVNGLESHWNALKKTTWSIRRLDATPEVNRVRQGLDLIEHQLHSLSRHVRSVRLLQQRSAWSLRLLGEQLQREVRRTRMVPVESAFQGFRKMVRDLARDEGKQIEFRISGFEVQADRMVLQAMKDPLMHILRNAVTHGIERPDERQAHGKPPAGLMLLRIESVGNRLTMTVEDDGRGIDLVKTAEIAARRRLISEEDMVTATIPELTRLLFQPGFSTARVVTELSGRGMGLSVVHEAVARLQGDVELRPREGCGTSLWLSVPLAMSTHRLLLVSCHGQTFAIPLYGIESLHRIKTKDLETVEGKPMVTLEGQLTSVALLAQLLGIETSDGGLDPDVLSLVVLRAGRKRLAVAVDALLAERDALIKKLGAPAESLNKFGGGMLLEDGTVALVLNPAEVIQAFRSSRQTPGFRLATADDDRQPPTILVVDDSFTTRTLETSILETHGYRVRVAVDGLEALVQLRSEKIDLVITDIQMPRLDGFGLLEEIKKDERLAHLPVIVVSSVDHREDQQRGLSLGADAYIVKRKFDHQDLLQTIEQIL
ncbi:MAG: Hpt domain-containing protein [Pirellulales bacterium]